MSWIRQAFDGVWNAIAGLAAGRTIAVIVGILCAFVAIGLFIASRKRLVQTKPITVAIILSVLAHIWLLIYASGLHDRLPPGDPRGSHQQPLAMAFQTLDVSTPAPDAPDEKNSADDQPIAPAPWEESPSFADLPQSMDLAELLSEQPVEPEAPPLLEPAPLPDLPPPAAVAMQEPMPSEQAAETQLADEPVLPPTNAENGPPAESISESVVDLPVPPQVLTPDQDVLPPDLIENRLTEFDDTPQSLADHSIAADLIRSDRSPVLPPPAQLPPDSPLPRDYQLRQAPNRLQLVRPFGADEQTEAAVENALAWLVAAQATDGSWVAADHGAGTETMALGEYRYATGGRADTGISGLALLAFLSAGHTHRDGEHRDCVARGLTFLLRAQMPSGDLSGAKQVGNDPSVVYARMYCHSIAALALAEAYAMTRDPVLRDAVAKATQYSMRAQDVRGGGWRYRPGDAGDLSQFGWQAMVLRSAQNSGLPVSDNVQLRMRQFLDSCAAGARGGLARYLPGEGRPSATMTAEALACRLLLDHPLSVEGRLEAEEMLMQHLPGTEPDNVYYWYYATLALFQLQDDRWRLWNESLKQRLVSTQLPAGHHQAGSWEPDSLWGGYGGRVYSTAMSCLCLEVYYRYLPMYQRAQLARQDAAEVQR